MARKNVDALSIALAVSIPWSASVFLIGLVAPYVGNWSVMVQWLSQFYVGYESTFIGSVIGGIWGFLDAFIGLYVIIWLYNYFLNRRS